MPDNLNIKHPQDGQRINIHEEWELNDWAKKLGVTKDELKQAVKQVGDRVVDVKKYLGK